MKTRRPTVNEIVADHLAPADRFAAVPAPALCAALAGESERLARLRALCGDRESAVELLADAASSVAAMHRSLASDARAEVLS